MTTIQKVWSFILLCCGLAYLSDMRADNQTSGCNPCAKSSVASDCNDCFKVKSDCNKCSDDCNPCKKSNDCCVQDKCCDSSCVSSRTTFVPQPLTADSLLDLPLGNYFFWHSTPCLEDMPFFNFQGSYFHRESRKECELAGFFLPGGKRCISVKEDGTGDVGSLWVDLISKDGTSYDSEFCLSPKRTVDGGFFNFYFDFNSWLCGTWLSIAFAAARVEHRLCVSETKSENEGTLTGFTNEIEAFNNPSWNHGRFSPSTLVRTGVDDVQFKLGWSYYFCNRDHLALYFVATAPTGCDSNNTYLFEPVLGSKHGSVGVGLNGDYLAWNCGNQTLNIMMDLKYRFVLSHCEKRLFDLCPNGEFSRYLQVVTEDQRSNSMPGVNYFAQNVDVTPGSTIDFWAALHYAWCDWHVEFGYNLFWKDSEKVCFSCPELCEVGIYDLNGDCLGNPVSSSKARIKDTVAAKATAPYNTYMNPAPSDLEFTKVRLCDFNKESGTHPRALTNAVYGALSYNTECWCMPMFLGFVGGYEFARCNTAFEQWTVQLKAGVAF